MSVKQLETRVAKLESEFELLKSCLKGSSGNGWRGVIGTHQGSSTFDSVVKEMRRLRRKDYEEAAGETVDSQDE